jgi:hypothetical protein
MSTLWRCSSTHLDEMLYTEEVSASHGYKEWGMAPLVLQVDAGACLQQNGDAAQIACMEHQDCVYTCAISSYNEISQNKQSVF